MPTANKLNLIPMVSKIRLKDSIFTLEPDTAIGVSDEKIFNKGSLLRNYLIGPTGYELPLSLDLDSPITLTLTETPQDLSEEMADESYTITVNNGQCCLKAPSEAGLARAIQSFRQLLPCEIFSDGIQNEVQWIIPGCEISDSPRFRWRGMHLDVCRHFFTKEEVIEFIDTIALYKFNRLHLHLTEDQGWRLEIKKYPRLTEIGAYRDSTLIGHANERPKRYEDKPYGGFYTHEDIREIVAYASEREIIIIPEIDMPGHMQAAISAYPELGCTDQTLKPLCHWGICEHILNIEDSTVQFFKDVLDEVMALFPGRYIHIGGDEALKYQWEESRQIQDRMLELGVKSEEELQSWFIRQMGEHLESNNRQVIGWDEILEGGLPEGAAVMSWRGEKGGIEAAKKGHNVVMTPEEYVYFDHYQGERESEPLAIHGFTTLEKVYEYEVIPHQLPLDQQHFMMGSQGQIWTEYIPDFKHLQYMVFPRAIALSENLWIKKENKNIISFLERLSSHRDILDKLGINYKK